jgi:hypothetical protein
VPKADRKRNPQILDLLQQTYRAREVLHHHAFGDFKLQQVRRHAGFTERTTDIVQEVGVDELAGRKVYRHADRRQPVPLPLHVLRTSGLEHPPADRNDQPGLLGQRDELVGLQQSEIRMLPA